MGKKATQDVCMKSKGVFVSLLDCLFVCLFGEREEKKGLVMKGGKF